MNAFDYFFEKSRALNKLFLEGKENISFSDLYESCNNLAGYLVEKYGRNKPILLISVNNLFFIKAYLSIIKSGNICVPLDPSVEKENFSFITQLTSPPAIFLTRDLEKKLNTGSSDLVFPEMLPGLTTSRTLDNEEAIAGDQCAEIIFTSGSTGKPKGVMLSHKNLVANTDSICTYLKLQSTDKMLVVLPFYYCYGLSLLHTHLRAGGSVVLNNSFMFLGTVINNLNDYMCTGFAGVPSHYQILMRRSETFRKTKFPFLRYVTQAGGKLATIFIDEFTEAFPGIEFYVMYGQTEATARLSYLPPELYKSRKGSIGKGIPGVELRVVNEMNLPVLPGETGEVIARGDNIMLGYYAEEQDTALILRNGWLYTGDLGTVDGDGYIYLTARKKEIIKMAGKRISPKEIENVILEVPDVVDCTIEGIYDDIFGETIKAIIVITRGKDNEAVLEKIKKHCAENLASYKVPAVFELSQNLVISATGKKVKQKI